MIRMSTSWTESIQGIYVTAWAMNEVYRLQRRLQSIDSLRLKVVAELIQLVRAGLRGVRECIPSHLSLPFLSFLLSLSYFYCLFILFYFIILLKRPTSTVSYGDDGW